mgnify:CR=1 FL=1
MTNETMLQILNVVIHCVVAQCVVACSASVHAKATVIAATSVNRTAPAVDVTAEPDVGPSGTGGPDIRS